MKHEPRTEVVSIRLTKAERARLDEMGGPSAAIRRLLGAEPGQEIVPITTGPTWPYTSVVVKGPWSTDILPVSGVVWMDETVGPEWPAVNSR